MLETIAKFSLKDYAQMIEMGIFAQRRVELIDGLIIEMSPEGTEHSYYGQTLADFFRIALFDRALIRENKPITLSTSEPEPDITIARLPATLYLSHHPYPEDIFLSVEVSKSTLSFDTSQKKKVYAKAGIRDYWVMDIRSKKLIIHRSPCADDYQEIFTLSSDGTISPLAFPEIILSINQIFISLND